MERSEVTFAFKGDRAFAIREGKVIATSHVDHIGDLEKVAFGHDPMGGQPPMGDPHAIDGPTEMPPPPGDMQDPYLGGDEPCPNCGQPNEAGSPVCVGCGAPLGDPHGDPHDPVGGMESQYPQDAPSPGIEMGGEAGPYMASITTPNGLKGKVLGKVAGLWQDEVTVRLENGRIVHLPVSKEMRFERTASAPKGNPTEQFEQRLAASVDGTRESLVTRHKGLLALQTEARQIIANGVSDTDAESLDQIVVAADVEIAEVNDAIAHLDDAETQAYAPPVPFSMSAAHEAAASLGGKDGSWLDKTATEMIAEVEATDFKRLMDEGPEALTADLDTPALADAGVVRQVATSFIRSKTAGTDPKVRDPYEATFIKRVEECRRAELSSRAQTTQKEAAVQEDAFKDAPDESIFM
jgi:hypothetical protein